MTTGLLDWLLVVSSLVLFFAVYFRRAAGFRSGKTLSRDDMTLRSERYGLVGRPDRIVRKGRNLIVVDKKSGTRLYDSHRAQMGVYMLLVEEHFGKRPSHAVVVLGDGRRVKVTNSKALRKQVLDVVAAIRKSRRQLNVELLADASPGKCRVCAQRENCNQRAAK